MPAAITHRPLYARSCGATGPAFSARPPLVCPAAIIRLGKATRHAGLTAPCQGYTPGAEERRSQVLRVRWSPYAVPALFLAVENVPSRLSLLGTRAPRVTPPVRRAPVRRS